MVTCTSTKMSDQVTGVSGYTRHDHVMPYYVLCRHWLNQIICDVALKNATL